MTSAELVAPFQLATVAHVASTLRHVLEVDAVTAAGVVLPLEVERVEKLSWDERTAPRVQAALECKVPDEEVLAQLDPRLGPRLRIRLGYVLPGGAEDVQLVADLGIRTRATRRPANVVELTAMSDEALVVDASPAIGLAVSGSSAPLAIRSLIYSAFHPDPPVTISHPDTTATSLVDVSDRWAAMDDLADTIDGDVYDDGLRSWHITRRPAVASRAAAILKVGPGGTLTESTATVTRDEWANKVQLRYRWRTAAGVEQQIVGTAQALTGPYAVGTAPLRIVQLERETPTTQAQANKAAAAVLARMLSRSRSYTLSAVAAYWLRPGHTVTVQLPTGAQARHLVSAVDFRPHAGTMTVDTRLPDTATTIGE